MRLNTSVLWFPQGISLNLADNFTNGPIGNFTPNATSWGPKLESASWSAVPVCFLIIMLLSTVLNGVVLYVIARDSHLKTAFNVYIVNLLLTNLVQTFIQMPLNIANYLRSYWWLGSTACTVFIYGLSIQAVMVCSHLLITMNRIWAVTSPVTYRNYHKKRLSIGLCVFIWIYVHAFFLPGLIADALYYRMPTEYGCFINPMAQLASTTAMEWCLFKIPVLLIICSYPYIAYKSLKARNTVSNQANATSLTVGRLRRATNDPTGAPAESSKQVSETAPDVQRKKGRRNRRGGFVLLTLMTLTMMVFWTPSLVYYTVISYMRVNWPVVEQAANILLLLETIADPICFTLALRRLREAVLRTLRRRPLS
ncbi:hypothetical protein RvY_16269 [Ramazzottius varieornatus]|uniref:G-protein coupled receptors family 1 profile domain-containing protein n=1 Tax=Ramazzottius varieornatus TaxID=947166 RepID=A0A1D1W5I4_RAMVA|nr:hypothetical protein RvY_16269 [Ramazzottius varieornatus]